MKNQVITLFMIISVCYGDLESNASIIVNDVTEPIPPVSVIPPGPSGKNDTNITTTTPPTTTSASTTTTPTPTTTSKTTPSTPTTTTTTTTTTPKPTTVTTPTTAKPTTPITPSVTTTKVAPTKSAVTTAVPPVTPTPANNRKFDGPSFVGGIVLASGLMAIGFVAFKFYKARTELNYHTL